MNITFRMKHLHTIKYLNFKGLITFGVTVKCITMLSVSCGLSALCLGEVLTNSLLKNLQYYESLNNGLVQSLVNEVMDIQIL